METVPSLPATYQEYLLARLVVLLAKEPRIYAAWLAGSLGRGDGDEFSDVDVLALVADGSVAAVSAGLVSAIEEAERPLLLNVLHGGRVVSVVTSEWSRFDVSFAEAADLPRYNARSLVPLFNHAGQEPPSYPPRSYRTSEEVLLPLIQEFLRVLGLSVVAAGRGEHLVMFDGVGLLRKMLVDLMLEENGIAPESRGGMLRRNPMLSLEQRAEFEAAPPLAATRESALEGIRYFAAAFLPRARHLAAANGVAWPSRLEQVTLANLQRHLGLNLP